MTELEEGLENLHILNLYTYFYAGKYSLFIVVLRKLHLRFI